MRHLCILLLFSCAGLSVQKSIPSDDHYIAAVVEYTVTRNVEANLVNYPQLIKEAADQGADIVVFPELTLTTSTTYFTAPIFGALLTNPIPAVQEDIYDQFMVTISKAARDNDIYVVVNGRERMDCTDPVATAGEECPEQKQYIFNTNIVFDRTGAVIDRFRKINLFGEYGHTPALQPYLGEFETDFGVRFGHFICFDLMFQVPAVQVVQKKQIKNIIFPTMWFSELPYLTAVQIQEAYAYALDVNFLGAGANNVGVGSAGSGIYSGKAGALVSIMPGKPTTKVLVAKVPKVPGQVTELSPGPIYDDPADHDNLLLITDPSLPSHVTRLLQPGSQEFTLNHRDVTCEFKVTLAQREGATQHYRYRAAAFGGVRSFTGVATGGSRICAIYACTGDSRGTCGYRFSTYTAHTTAIFQELSITATMPTPSIVADKDADNAVVYPVSSTVSIMPLESKDFDYTTTTSGTNTIHTMTLKNSDAELYGFAVWGRRFSTDGQVEDPPLTDEEGDLTPTEGPPTDSPPTESPPTESPPTEESTPESTTEEQTTPPTTPEPDASAVHLLSRVLFAAVVALICYTQF